MLELIVHIDSTSIILWGLILFALAHVEWPLALWGEQLMWCLLPRVTCVISSSTCDLLGYEPTILAMITTHDKHILISWGCPSRLHTMESHNEHADIKNILLITVWSARFLLWRSNDTIIIYFNQSSIDTKSHLYLLYLSLLSTSKALRRCPLQVST